MNFQISSEELANPPLVEILRKVTFCFEELGQEFFVIGATARDILVRLSDKRIISSRRTRDLDLAIAIPDWQAFGKVQKTLLAHGFTKDRTMYQRFYDGNYELDIVPYGGVAKEDDYIYWPPEEDIAMSVKGFAEVLSNAITVVIDQKLKIKIASLHGLFILKFNAWLERNNQTDKDAQDIEFIIKNYFAINVEQNLHSEVYCWETFDEWTVGAYWLAHDIAQLLSTAQRCFYVECLENELGLGAQSPFIRQMLRHNKALHFDQVRCAVLKMIEVFQQTPSRD